MLRFALLAIALAVAATGACAQDVGDAASPDAAGSDGAVDFVLRPTEAADLGQTNEPQPELSALEAPIGPPLAGPTGKEPIGPPLAGPTPLRPPEAAARRRRAEPADPFAATGVRLGTFVIRPSIEIGVNATDNPAGSHEKHNAVGFILAPAIEISSEDTDHSIEANAKGTFIFYGDQTLDERDATARVKGRYDLTSRTSLEGEVGYSYTLDRFTDPDTPENATERPPVHDFDASFGVTQRFGRVSVGLAGTVEREVHENVPLSGGGESDLSELNNTEYGLRLRTGFEASAAITPYVQTAFGRRHFDQADEDGTDRSSVWGELRGGLIFDFGSKLSGDVSAGWRHEDLEDDQLDDLDGPVAAASILWSPRRLWDVRLDLTTQAETTTIADSPGSMLYSGTLSVSRQVTPRFKMEVGGGLDYEHFIGVDRDDTTPAAYTQATYAFNRTASLIARYGYERTYSTEEGQDSEENVVSVRVRLQH
jgi:hypothetical protein